MKKVNKKWGDELWIVNKDYCGKLLNIKKGHQCSLHFHINKNETFYLLKGKIKIEYNKKKKIMNPGDVQHIKPWMNHRFTGLKDSIIIEFSTHHKNSDSYRLEESK